MNQITPRLFLLIACLWICTACQSQEASTLSEKPAEPLIGETVQLGELTYKVNNAYKTKFIKSQFQIELEPDNGTFLVISLTIDNQSSKELLLKERMFRVTDPQGNIFKPITGLDQWLNRKEGGLYNRPIQPLSSKSVSLIFDVPDKATSGYLLQTHGIKLDQNLLIRLQQ